MPRKTPLPENGSAFLPAQARIMWTSAQFENSRAGLVAAELDFFFDSCGLTGKSTQVIELGTAHITAALHFN